VAQEAFARLWRDRGSLSGELRVVTAWLYRTATRLTVDRLRARKLEPHVEAELAFADWADPPKPGAPVRRAGFQVSPTLLGCKESFAARGREGARRRPCRVRR
jgi:DNA-directed RNA polymerase specialized sigma24 family protein